MKLFKVDPGTQGLLVTETSTSPFTTRKELTFEREELVFDPVQYANGRIDQQWAELASRGYAGFKRPGGMSGKDYMLVIHYAHVEVLQ